VVDDLLARGKAVITSREYMLSAATETLQDLHDAKWQRRTVLVRDVPDDMEETLVMYLESRRKGGGDIETISTDTRSRTVMVTFQDEHGMSVCLVI